MPKKRIGILTSGGDCPGLNAVIRGAVKSCHHLGYDCIGFLKGYEGLYDPVQYVQLTPKNTAGTLQRGGTILGSTNKGRFAATVGVQDRKELDPELVEGVRGTFEQLGLDGLICVGGDGSLAVAQQFHEKGLPVVGVPKTIDNDLSATAFTFGFDSAIECATDALDRLHTTAASHERIMVLEVMGRHAGWIALHSGIAGGGDVILIPEVKWDFEHVCHKILHRESQGKKFTLVVVAEGAELPDGGLVGNQVEGQQMKLGGVGKAVVDAIETRLHREARLCVLGHLQRGGSPTTFDRVLATQFGAHAVRLIKEGRFGEMICSRPPEMTSVPILEAVNVLRQVNPHGPAIQAARALGISFGDRPADCDRDVFQDVEQALEATLAGGALEEPAEPAPAEEISPEEVLSTEPATEATAAPEPTPLAAEEVEIDTDEDVAAEEEVAEEVLDLLADVDETTSGEVALEEVMDDASEATEAVSTETMSPSLADAAEQMQQKLAEASQDLQKQPVETSLSESLPEPATLAAPVDEPLDAELVEDARQAIEQALPE